MQRTGRSFSRTTHENTRLNLPSSSDRTISFKQGDDTTSGSRSGRNAYTSRLRSAHSYIRDLYFNGATANLTVNLVDVPTSVDYDFDLNASMSTSAGNNRVRLFTTSPGFVLPNSWFGFDNFPAAPLINTMRFFNRSSLNQFSVSYANASGLPSDSLSVQSGKRIRVKVVNRADPSVEYANYTFRSVNRRSTAAFTQNLTFSSTYAHNLDGITQLRATFSLESN